LFRTRRPRTEPQVLIVDDDPSVRHLLDRALRTEGFQTLTVMDIPSGMSALRAHSIAAVILDMLFVNSAGQSGLDLLRHVRSVPQFARLPVLVLTGFTLNNDVISEVKALGGELWQKPISPRALTERLKALVAAS
jgi:two-component system, OmpR family, response regulator